MKTKKNAVKVRPATIADAPEIAALERECIECPWSEKQIAESIESPGYTFLVAEYNENFAGYVGLEWCLDEGNICNVAVSPDVRRAGVASALVTELQNAAKKRETAKLFLEVNENNVAAKSLYDKFGFVVLYVRPNYYRDAAAIVMVKEIG